MKMIPKTKLTESAKAARFHNGWILCILITLLLFAISSALQSVVLMPAMMVYLLGNSSMMGAMQSGNFADLMQAVTGLMTNLPSWLILLQLALTAVVIVVCLIYATKIEKRSLASVGFVGSKPFVEYLIGLVLGFVMLAASLLLCVVTGTATFTGISPTISWVIVLYFAGYLVQGMSEEVLCRGILMQKLAIRYAPIIAILLNAVFFAALHLGNPGITPLAIPNLILFGVFASLYMWKRGNIWGIAALHSMWNFTQGNVFGVQVSGTPQSASILGVSMKDGAAWMNGGSFGLEGGLAVTIVLAIGIVVLLLLPVRKEARLDS